MARSEELHFVPIRVYQFVSKFPSMETDNNKYTYIEYEINSKNEKINQ